MQDINSKKRYKQGRSTK